MRASMLQSDKFRKEPDMKRYVFSASLFAFALIAGCAQSGTSDIDVTATETATTEIQTSKSTKQRLPEQRTVKPGAAITFSHEMVGKPNIGQRATVRVNMIHGYAEGQMDLQATTDESISLGLNSQSKTVILSEPGTVTWDLDYLPTQEGKKYINVLATVTSDNGLAMGRSYAIRVNTGEAIQQKSEPDGSPTIMQAEEVIIQ